MRREEEEAANLSQLRVGVLFNAQVCGILRRPTGAQSYGRHMVDGQAQWAECTVESEWRDDEGGGGEGCSGEVIEVGKREKIA